MSRIGKKPIAIPSGVTVTEDAKAVTVKGPKGEMVTTLLPGISASVADGQIIVACADDTRQGRSFFGLVRSLIANTVEGVSQGFKKELEIEGVGYRAAIQGQNLSLSLGFASPVEHTLPEGITVAVDKTGTKLEIEGIDKQKVGDTAAQIRSYYPAEPYKGKGIRYKDEKVRRKVGKTVA